MYLLRQVLLKRHIQEEKYPQIKVVPAPISDQAHWWQDAQCFPFLANAYPSHLLPFLDTTISPPVDTEESDQTDSFA